MDHDVELLRQKPLAPFFARFATVAKYSALQYRWNPHEHWLCGVSSGDQISELALQWLLFPGSSGGDDPMATDDFFRARLDQMIDLRHPLAVLATRMPWAQIDASFAPLFAHRRRPGRMVTDADLLGTTAELVGAGVSNAGRSRLSIRLMVALLYLKHAYNESDESVVQRWAHDVYFQSFSGRVYFEPRVPCDDSQIGRFRQVLGEAGVEQLLKTTIEAAVDMGAIKRTEFERVIVDTTVQEKEVAHPSDSRLLEVARACIAQLATRAGIKLKQSYAPEGQQLRRRAGGYAEPGHKASSGRSVPGGGPGLRALCDLQGHARQFKRLRRLLRRQHIILGRLVRAVECELGDSTQANLKFWIDRGWKIQPQRLHDSNRLYALHAPEVEYSGEGKSRQPFEFGVKLRMPVTHKSGVVVGARSLAGQIEQTTTLLQDVGVKPTTALADLGYRGVDHLVPVSIIHRGRYKTMTDQHHR